MCTYYGQPYACGHRPSTHKIKQQCDAANKRGSPCEKVEGTVVKSKWLCIKCAPVKNAQEGDLYSNVADLGRHTGTLYGRRSLFDDAEPQIRENN
jgi:hypothetical protein